MTSDEINRAIVARRPGPRDYITDEAASAELLEEMPEPTLMKELDQWMCDPDGTNNPDLCYFAKDRKTAVALAWCRWKGVEVQP